MTPRPRKPKNRALPPNLYESKRGKWVSYKYRHPITRKFHGLGADKAKAIEAAKQLNSLLMQTSDLVAGVMGAVTVAEHIDWFFSEIVPGREYASSTVAMYRGQSNLIKRTLGAQPVETVTVREISDLMATLPARSAQLLRLVAADLFKTAAGRGLIEHNPAELTNKPVAKKSRSRLTVDQYHAIFNAAPTWLQNAMQIGLLSLQRREDVSKMRFDGIKENYLFVIQEKTKKYDTGYLKIELGTELKEVIARCRDDVASPYLIHRKPDRKLTRPGCDHWTQVTPDMITKTFKEVRDNLDLFKTMKESTKPTFHEIRALGIKLYKDAGFDPQKLAGHSSQQMTKNYDSGHAEIRWIETKTR